MRATITFKGGAGSGHHGHAGRPGKIGGSASSTGIVMPDNPTFQEYVSVQSWNKLGITTSVPVVVRTDDLPLQPTGTQRLFHMTHNAYIGSILLQGVKPGKDTGHKEGLVNVLSVGVKPGDDIPQSVFGGGGIYVVADVKPEFGRFVNTSWYESPHIVKDDIVAVYLQDFNTGNNAETIRTYIQYMKDYGD